MASPGLNPARDRATHGRTLNSGFNDIPGAFNEAIGDASERANLLTVTRAARLARKPEDCWPELRAVDTDYPDDGVWRWTGSGWRKADAFQRVWWFSAGSILFDLVNPTGGYQTYVRATIPNARPGTWVFTMTGHLDAAVDGASIVYAHMVAAGKNLSGDMAFEDVRSDSYVSVSGSWVLQNHVGGDLVVSFDVYNVNLPLRLYKQGRGILATYLGPYA